MSELFDVIVDHFPDGAGPALEETFGIDAARADALVRSAPTVVRRRATREQAQNVVRALSNMGASVRVQRCASVPAPAREPVPQTPAQPPAREAQAPMRESQAKQPAAPAHAAPQRAAPAQVSPYTPPRDEPRARFDAAAPANSDLWQSSSMSRPATRPSPARPVPSTASGDEKPRTSIVTYALGVWGVFFALVSAALDPSTVRFGWAYMVGAALLGPALIAGVISMFVRDKVRRRARFVAAFAVVTTLSTCGNLTRRAQERGTSIGAASPAERQVLLQDAVAEINKKLPMMVDESTQLVSAKALDDAILYNCRIVDVEASELDSAEVVEVLRPTVRDGVCSTPSTRDGLLKQGITMKYSYADAAGTHIADFEIAPSDCP